MYPPYDALVGPFPLQISMKPDPVTQRLLAVKIAGWGDRAETMIWMDGRPHPSRYAPHSHSGFTTGEWEGDTLTAVTTHFKMGDIKRHRGFSSDRATLTYRFYRHGDTLTVTGILEDPVYLAEPYVPTEIFRLGTNPNGFPLTACEPIEELPSLHENPALAPHYLPGKHPAMNEVTSGTTSRSKRCLAVRKRCIPSTARNRRTSMSHHHHHHRRRAAVAPGHNSSRHHSLATAGRKTTPDPL